MSSLNLPAAGNLRKDRSPHPTEDEFAEKLRAGWVILVLLVSGIFALISAVLIAWPALAFIAARFFQ